MKGFFSQCYIILVAEEIDFQELKKIIEEKYKIAKIVEGNENWEISNQSLVIPYRPEVNGFIAIDYVNKKWPDSMGSKDEPILFGAWSTGNFGPFTYPNCLKRSIEQAWTLSAEEKQNISYNGFIRIKISYVFGANESATILPADYKPIDELIFLNKMVSHILLNNEESYFFNPNGEVLLPSGKFQESIKYSENNNIPALDVFSNVRLYRINERTTFMDSVGNHQLDIPDIEVINPKEKYNLNDISRFIRNTTYYMMINGLVLKDGHTIDGPNNEKWKIYNFENGICDPPRNTIRIFPNAMADIPNQIMPQIKNRKWWKIGK